MSATTELTELTNERALGRAIELMMTDAPMGFVALDAGLRVVHANAAAAALVGLTISELVGRDGLTLVHPDDIGMATDALFTLGNPERSAIPSVVRLQTSSGPYRSVEAWVQATDHHSQEVAFVLSFRDAGAALEVDDFVESVVRSDDIRVGLTCLARSVEASGPFRVGLLWGWDGSRFNDVAIPDEAFAELFRGAEFDQIVGSVFERGTFCQVVSDLPANGRDLVEPSLRFGFSSFLAVPIVADGFASGALVAWYRHVGEFGSAGSRLCRRIANLAAIALVRQGIDARLRAQASTDSLTGLANRAAFLDRLSTALARSEPFALLLLDLDEFKSVNDTHGHLVGDRVLVELATRMMSSSRKDDVVARLGGDEFAILLHGEFAEDELEETARRLSDLLSFEVATDVGPIEIGLSVGAASSTGRDDVEDIIGAADRAMYSVKRARAQSRLVRTVSGI